MEPRQSAPVYLPYCRECGQRRLHIDGCPEIDAENNSVKTQRAYVAAEAGGCQENGCQARQWEVSLNKANADAIRWREDLERLRAAVQRLRNADNGDWKLPTTEAMSALGELYDAAGAH